MVLLGIYIATAIRRHKPDCAKLIGDGKVSSAPTRLKILLRTQGRQERTHLPVSSDSLQIVLQQLSEIMQPIPPWQKQEE